MAIHETEKFLVRSAIRNLRRLNAYGILPNTGSPTTFAGLVALITAAKQPTQEVGTLRRGIEALYTMKNLGVIPATGIGTTFAALLLLLSQSIGASSTTDTSVVDNAQRNDGGDIYASNTTNQILANPLTTV